MLCHITPTRNLLSIRLHGLDPSFSPRDASLRAVYLCEEKNLLWAIEHTRERHHATDLTLLVLPERVRALTRPLRLSPDITAQVTGWVLPPALFAEIPLWGLRQKCLELGISSKSALRRKIERGSVVPDFATSFGPLWLGAPLLEKPGILEEEIPDLRALEAIATDL